MSETTAAICNSQLWQDLHAQGQFTVLVSLAWQKGNHASGYATDLSQLAERNQPHVTASEIELG